MPIAGRGSRFAQAGFTLPKPLIPIHGKPMIEVVVNNVRPRRPHRFIFLALQECLNNTNMSKVLKRIAPECVIIPVATVTEGAACTVLLAKDIINSDDPLMLANGDQWVDININDYLASLDNQQADGLIMTMWANDPKWSYIRFSDACEICEVVEKQVVSNEATVGIYNYRRGADFVRAAENMLVKNLRVNNEFYVAPAYNGMIAEGLKIIYFNIGKEADGMYGLGIPSDLELFKKLKVSQKAVG